jgi:hypothetical protein
MYPIWREDILAENITDVAPQLRFERIDGKYIYLNPGSPQAPHIARKKRANTPRKLVGKDSEAHW